MSPLARRKGPAIDAWYSVLADGKAVLDMFAADPAAAPHAAWLTADRALEGDWARHAERVVAGPRAEEASLRLRVLAQWLAHLHAELDRLAADRETVLDPALSPVLVAMEGGLEAVQAVCVELADLALDGALLSSSRASGYRLVLEGVLAGRPRLG